MLGHEWLAIHFISNQNVRVYAINGHILDIGFDADTGEIAIVRAGRPHKSNGRPRLAFSKNVGEARASPGHVANAVRRLSRRQWAASALVYTRHRYLLVSHEVGKREGSWARGQSVNHQ